MMAVRLARAFTGRQKFLKFQGHFHGWSDAMLESVGSDLNHVIHVNVFLKDMRDFEGMNRAYIEQMGDHRPARTVIGVNELPKPGVLLTMNLTAVTRE